MKKGMGSLHRARGGGRNMTRVVGDGERGIRDERGTGWSG